MRAGTALQNGARVLEFGEAAERECVLAQQRDHFLEQLRKRHQLATCQVEQALVGAVAHRPPAILGEQHVRVHAPLLIAVTQPEQHAQRRLHQRRKAGGVIDAGRAIHDARLERLVAPARSQVPPDLGGVVDETGLDQQVDVSLVLAPAGESLRQPGARQRAENREPERLEAGRLAFPERRGRGQREEVRQEVGQLVHQVDALFVVLDADVHVHATDQHAPRRRLHFLQQRNVAILFGVLLLHGACERVGRGGNRR